MDPRIGQWCEDSDGDWGFVVGVVPIGSGLACIPCGGVCTTLLPDAEVRRAPDPIPEYALPAVEAFGARAEVAALRAELAKARGLRLGRVPTVEEIDTHPGEWIFWVWDNPMLGAGEMRQIEGPGELAEEIEGTVFDAIPIDANGQPCPVGGWEVSDG